MIISAIIAVGNPDNCHPHLLSDYMTDYGHVV